MKNANIIPLIILIGAFTALPANAEMYKWKDKNGEVHYTQTPPPAGVESKDIEDDIKLSTGKLGDGNKAKPPSKTKDNLADAEDAGKKSEDKHRDFCTQQENTLKQMTASSLIKWKDDKGERYLTAEEKATKIKELKQNLESMCRPEMFADGKNRNTSNTEQASDARFNASDNDSVQAGNGGNTKNNTDNTGTDNATTSNSDTASASTTAPAAQ